MRALVWSTAVIVGVGLGVAASSCGSKHGDAQPDVDGGAATDDAGGGGGEDAGTDAAPTGPVVPNGIKHIVVLLKENRTFDNYFTGFPGADTSTQAKLSTGQTITRPPAPDAGTSCLINHSYPHAVEAYDNGKMDKFDVGVYSCPGGDNRPFWAFTESQIPNYWQYARNFAISDRFFSTVNSESTPGHLALVMAQSPAYENPNGCLTPIECGCIAPQNATIATFDPASCATSTAYPCFDVPSIVDALPTGYTWMSYGQGKGTASESTFNFVKSIGSDAAVREAHYRDLDQLMTDMGTPAQANLVFAFVGPSPISEGPPDDPCAGESFTVTAVNKIMQSSSWNDSIVVVTWDDWGGNYDHVVPPVEACANGTAFYGGFRLPIILISPFAKKGTVAHTPTEQASIPKLIEDLWGMPRMSARDPHARDEKAGSLLEAFDFQQPPAAPLVLTPRTCN